MPNYVQTCLCTLCAFAPDVPWFLHALHAIYIWCVYMLRIHSHSAFSLCTIFWAQLKWIDNNDNDNKYNSNRHIFTEKINYEKTETSRDEYI